MQHIIMQHIILQHIIIIDNVNKTNIQMRIEKKTSSLAL